MLVRYYLRPPPPYHSLSRATEGSSGFDLRYDPGQDPVEGENYNEVWKLALYPGERRTISTGLYLEMPQGVEAQIRSRSGLARDRGVAVLNSPGTIDSDYRGELSVVLINHGDEPFLFSPGKAIAQLVFAPILPLPQTSMLSQNDSLRMIQELQTLTLLRVQSLRDLKQSKRGADGFGSTDQEKS